MVRSSPAARIARFVLGAGIALALAGTLVPTGSQTHPFSYCLFCAPRATADAIGNIALFVPVGATLRVLVGRPWIAALLAAAVSATLEIAQLHIPGRDPNITDLLTNTTGATIGALFVYSVRDWLSPRPALAARLVVASALCACGIWMLTGLGVAPSMNRSLYWGQWTPHLASMQPYQGRVLDARIGEMPVKDGPVTGSGELRHRLARRDPVIVRVAAGPATPSLKPIFSIADEDGKRVLLIGALGDDLAFRYRPRAADWRFDQPDLRLDGIFAGVHEGDSMQIEVDSRADSYCMRLNERSRCGVGYGLGDGWALLLSATSVTEKGRVFVQLFWMAAVVLPVGYFARLSGASAIAAASLAAALILVPVATDVLAVRPQEWIGIALGLGTGMLTNVALRLTAVRLPS